MKSRLLILNAVLMLSVHRYGMCLQYRVPNRLSISHSKQVLPIDTTVYWGNVLAKQASFNNSESILSNYIINKFRFPKGFVFKRKTHLRITFIVEKNGKRTNYQSSIFSDNLSENHWMQEIALAIIKKMPLFNPAILKGKKVRSWYCIEIVNCIERKIAISSHVVFQCNPTTDDLCYSFNPCNDPKTDYDNRAQSYSDPLPSFLEGNDSMNSFITTSTKYPLNAKENGVEGRVLVSFVVEKDGSLSNFLVVKGIGWGCDEEAVRIVKSFPKWIPGKSNNQTVRVEMTIPINFRLN